MVSSELGLISLVFSKFSFATRAILGKNFENNNEIKDDCDYWFIT